MTLRAAASSPGSLPWRATCCAITSAASACAASSPWTRPPAGPPPTPIPRNRWPGARSGPACAALWTLPERERDLLGLKFGAGLTNRQIAAVSGLSESNVGVLIYRAVRKLRAACEEPAGKEHTDGRA